MSLSNRKVLLSENKPLVYGGSSWSNVCVCVENQFETVWSFLEEDNRVSKRGAEHTCNCKYGVGLEHRQESIHLKQGAVVHGD